MMSLFLFLVLGVVVIVSEAAADKVCYFTQEPDSSEANRLRWIQPFKDMCSCTSIRPGGLYTVAPNRKTKPIYTDQPIFTDDQEEIHDHYGCHDTFTDCQALLDAGYREDGIYTIYPFQNDEGIKVLCDMTMNTGWIVVQRRYNGSVNFNRNWAEYKDGFGSMDGEFWLGNEILHKLTDAEGKWTIRLDLTNEHNSTGHLMETPFHIGPDNYTLSMEHLSIQPTVGRYCGHALGMEDKSIPDDRITASSQYGSKYRPSNARLNLNRYWCPDEGQNSDSWLQVDMGTEPVQIEGVITQGYLDDEYDSNDEYYMYVKHYQVQYSIDGDAWLYVDGTSTPQTFRGNTDTDTPVTNMFKQPIQARYIRIRPTDWKDQYPAIRIELLGCRGGILETANNQAFSIHHHTDFNQGKTNCPSLNSEGGWWFRCSGIPGVDNNLNAEYIQPGDIMGSYERVIKSSEWNGSRIARTEIKIRRQSPPRG